MTLDDCRELVSRGLIVADRTGRPIELDARLMLTDAGLLFLQEQIPIGAIRPVYQIASRKLSVAGEVIIPLAVQARNQTAVLTAIELAGWAARIIDPLGDRSRSNDPHQLTVTIHNLNLSQPLIDFHSDDGAAIWSWRPCGSRTAAYRPRSTTREL